MNAVPESTEVGVRRTSCNACHPLFQDLDQNHFSCFYANVENAEEGISDSRRANQSRARRNTSRRGEVNDQDNSTESTPSQTTGIPPPTFTESFTPTTPTSPVETTDSVIPSVGKFLQDPYLAFPGF